MTETLATRPETTPAPPAHTLDVTNPGSGALREITEFRLVSLPAAG
jgi:hypothetical protein